MKAMFDVCTHFRARVDFAHKTGKQNEDDGNAFSDYNALNGSYCRCETGCNKRGNCVVARDPFTGKKVNTK